MADIKGDPIGHAPAQCPSCASPLTIAELCCGKCGTKVQGHFEACPYCALDEANREFLDSFVRCQGVIKDMEAHLGISYPTVKSRMQALLHALGLAEPPPDRQTQQRGILSALERNEIDVKEAERRLKALH